MGNSGHDWRQISSLRELIAFIKSPPRISAPLDLEKHKHGWEWKKHLKECRFEFSPIYDRKKLMIGLGITGSLVLLVLYHLLLSLIFWGCTVFLSFCFVMLAFKIVRDDGYDRITVIFDKKPPSLKFDTRNKNLLLPKSIIIPTPAVILLDSYYWKHWWGHSLDGPAVSEKLLFHRVLLVPLSSVPGGMENVLSATKLCQEQWSKGHGVFSKYTDDEHPPIPVGSTQLIQSNSAQFSLEFAEHLKWAVQLETIDCIHWPEPKSIFKQLVEG